MDRQAQTTELGRRTFLTTTSAALVGAALGGLAPRSEAVQRHPQRGGVLQFGARVDTAGLDSHRHNQLHTSHPTAAMYTGLTDIDQQGNIVPGIAESWEPNQDLTAWVFRLRKGVLFHNGDEIVGKPKKEDSVRLTALRTGQVHLIDAIAYADVERFKKSSEDKYNLWTTHFGGSAVVFNFRRGPFQDQRLRTAAAHAIDRQAIHNSVFYG